MAVKKDRVVSLFQSKFRVIYFHKPTMNPGDEFYYIVLENLLRLKIRSHIGNVLVIEEAIPTSMRYVKEFEDDLITLLTENKSFTILISCIGYTGSIGKICKTRAFNIVEEDRLVSYPKPFYDRMKSLENAKVNQYGFYLLAVADNSFIEDNNKYNSLEDVLSIIKKTHLLEKSEDKFRIGSILTTNITVEDNNVIFSNMEKISHSNPFMFYIRFTELLETICESEYNVYLKDIIDTTLFSVCMNKHYTLLNKSKEINTIFGKISGDSLGSFQVKK